MKKFLTNKYLITGLLFASWMIFLDQYNLMTQWELYTQISNLKKQIAYYDEEIKKTNQDKEALFGNINNLERFARETYWMKKDNEDLFILYNEEAPK